MVVSLLLAACFETLPARGIPVSAGSLGTLILQPEPGADSVRVWRDVLFEVDVKAWADSLLAKRKRKKAAKDSITASGSFKDRKTGNPQPVSKTEDVLMVSRDSVPAASSRKRRSDSAMRSDTAKQNKEGNFWQRTVSGHEDRTFEQAFDYSLVLFPTYTNEGSFGIGGIGAALFRLDRSDSLMPPSDLSLEGNASLRGFFYAGAYGTLYFPGRRSRLYYEVSFSQQNLDFWGICYDSCHVRPPVSQTRWNVMALGYYDYRVLKNFYIGAALDFSYNNAVKMADPAYLDGQRSSYILTGIGLSLQYDSRDYAQNPTQGLNLLLRQMVYPSFMGDAGRTLWRTTFTASYYQRLWRGAVLATELYAECNAKDMPWPLKESVGGYYRLRGYYQGRYMDNNLFSFQLELRQKLFWRVGLVAFGGFGSVFSSFQDWRADQLLPAYGVGLRFEFKHNLNVRLDCGWGREVFGVVFAIGESF